MSILAQLKTQPTTGVRKPTDPFITLLVTEAKGTGDKWRHIGEVGAEDDKREKKTKISPSPQTCFLTNPRKLRPFFGTVVLLFYLMCVSLIYLVFLFSLSLKFLSLFFFLSDQALHLLGDRVSFLDGQSRVLAQVGAPCI